VARRISSGKAIRALGSRQRIDRFAHPGAPLGVVAFVTIAAALCRFFNEIGVDSTH